MRGKRQGRRKSTIRSSDSLDLVSFEGVPGGLDYENLTRFCRPDGRKDRRRAPLPQHRPPPILVFSPLHGAFLSLAWGLAISQEDYDFAAHLESGYGRYGGKKVARTWRRCAGTDHAIGQLCAVRTDR